MKKALIIHFDAPLQSWGTSSLFQRRDAGAAPSKSALGGMICAAIGAPKRSGMESAILQSLSLCHMTSYHAHGRILTDYHTVLNTKNANGTLLKNAVITHRQYWENTRFVVVLESDDEAFLNRVHAALQHPVWGGWLGRKCCIPAAPLIQEEICNADEAHSAAKEFVLKPRGHESRSASVECFKEVDTFEEGTDTWRDAPLGFGLPHSSGFEGRNYGFRRINHRIIPAGENDDFRL